MTTILHIVRNPVTYDSRVLKETASIVATWPDHRLEIAGFHEPGFSEQEDISCRRVQRWRLSTRSLPKNLPGQSIKYAEWHLKLVSYYGKQPIKIIHCHDLGPLPIAVHLKQRTGAALIYDAHELETEMFNLRGIRQKLARRLEPRLIRSVDHMITVSPSIQHWYKKRFPNVPVSLIRNVPERTDAPVVPQPLRKEFEVPDDALLFIYLGGLSRGRGIELALDAFKDSRVPHHILFLGDGPLRGLVESAVQICPRIHYRQPVPPAEVISYASGADVGLCLYEDTCLNHRYCLPNKLFETLVAGLPVFVSDLPDQAQLVRQYQAGWVVSNQTPAIVDQLTALTVDSVRMLREGLLDRTRNLSWTSEAESLLAIYRELGQEQGLT